MSLAGKARLLAVCFSLYMGIRKEQDRVFHARPDVCFRPYHNYVFAFHQRAEDHTRKKQNKKLLDY